MGPFQNMTIEWLLASQGCWDSLLDDQLFDLQALDLRTVPMQDEIAISIQALAAAQGNPQAIRVLQKLPNFPNLVECGMPLIWYAAMLKNWDFVEALLGYEIDLDASYNGDPSADKRLANVTAYRNTTVIDLIKAFKPVGDFPRIQAILNPGRPEDGEAHNVESDSDAYQDEDYFSADADSEVSDTLSVDLDSDVSASEESFGFSNLYNPNPRFSFFQARAGRPPLQRTVSESDLRQERSDPCRKRSLSQ